jgi:hypothetical protein
MKRFLNRALSIPFAFLLGSTALAAQVINQYHPQKFDLDRERKIETILDVRPVDAQPVQSPEACPIPMSARQGSDGALVAVSPAQPGQPSQKGISQRIRLFVNNGAKVVSARVTVHGFTAKARMLPVDSSQDGAAQISRNLEISFSNDATNNAGANLLLRGFSAVFAIDVNSITYTDGSIWKTSGNVCRVVPDPVMLVDAR